MLNINSILNDSVKILSNYYIKTPKLDAEILLSSVLKKSINQIIFDDKINISEFIKPKSKNQKSIFFKNLNFTKVDKKSKTPIAYQFKLSVVHDKKIYLNSCYYIKNYRSFKKMILFSFSTR